MAHDHNHDHEERELITLVDEQKEIETLFGNSLTIDGKVWEKELCLMILQMQKKMKMAKLSSKLFIYRKRMGDTSTNPRRLRWEWI